MPASTPRQEGKNMNSQTERPVKRSVNQRSTRSTKSRRYHKQTSHAEKVKIQRRATWAMAGFFGLLIVGTIVGFWITINIIIPGQPITSVNGHQIPQSQFRKMVAVKTQLELNKLYGVSGLVAQGNDLQKQDAAQLKTINDLTKQVDALNKQIKALPAGSSQQRTDLENQLKTVQKQLSDAQAK